MESQWSPNGVHNSPTALPEESSSKLGGQRSPKSPSSHFVLAIGVASSFAALVLLCTHPILVCVCALAHHTLCICAHNLLLGRALVWRFVATTLFLCVGRLSISFRSPVGCCLCTPCSGAGVCPLPTALCADPCAHKLSYLPACVWRPATRVVCTLLARGAALWSFGAGGRDLTVWWPHRHPRRPLGDGSRFFARLGHLSAAVSRVTATHAPYASDCHPRALRLCLFLCFCCCSNLSSFVFCVFRFVLL